MVIRVVRLQILSFCVSGAYFAVKMQSRQAQAYLSSLVIIRMVDRGWNTKYVCNCEVLVHLVGETAWTLGTLSQLNMLCSLCNLLYIVLSGF